MNLSRFASIVFLSGLAIARGAAAANVEAAKDWPQFRGPARDNISKETGLLKAWPSEGPPLAWKATGLGEGYSSVSISNGKIFTAGDGSDSSYLVALAEADGKILWKSKLGPTGNPNNRGAGPRSTPTVDGDRVYVIGQGGDIAGYQVADGKQLWHKNLNLDFGGKLMKPGIWGNSESLVVDGDKVICTPGGSQGTLLALDKMSGEPIWRSTDLKDDASYMAPVVADTGGAHQAIVLTDQSIAGIAVADGKLLWRNDRPGKTAVIPTPIVKGNYVYVTSGYSIGCDLFEITKEESHFSVKAIYHDNKNMQNHHGGVILVGDCIYGFSDKLWTCQDLMTGKVNWTDKSLGKGTLSYADGRFYLREENKQKGTIALWEASPEGHKELGRFALPKLSGQEQWPHLVIANGKLYVRDEDTLWCYDVKAK